MSDGVLLMGFGGPSSLDEVAEFCTNLMGREPSAEVLERVKRRYLTIGGASPLPEMARKIAEKLHEKLSEDGKAVPLSLGMRYSAPSIEGGVRGLLELGVDRIVTVSLSPFESAHSSGAYRAAVAKAVAVSPDVTVAEAPSIRQTAVFLNSMVDNAQEAVSELKGKRTGLIFTAHSLPVEEIGGDPYVEQLRETADAIAARSHLTLASSAGKQTWLPGVNAYGSADERVPWLVSYQSKGQRPGKWLEPDVLDVLRAMAKAGFEAVAFAPIGFATDHMETLFDIDVEAAGLALDLGMEYERASVLNDSTEMVEALAAVVEPLLR